MLSVFRRGGLSLSSYSFCIVFEWSAQAGPCVLERRFHTSSISCLYKSTADLFFTLKRVSLRSSGSCSRRPFWRSSGCSLSEKILGGENPRSSGLVFALERMCFVFVSWSSSGPSCAQAGPVFVLAARASCSTLERGCRISVDS